MHLGGEFGWIRGLIQAKFMHDPISLATIWSSASVEHQCLPHTNKHTHSVHLSVFSGGFPVARLGGSVCPLPGGVLAVFQAEEVPFLPLNTCHFCLITTRKINIVYVWYS